jgi:hypothetical protein
MSDLRSSCCYRTRIYVPNFTRVALTIRITLYKIMAITALIPRSESCTVTKWQRRKLEGAEMNFLTNVDRCTLMENIRHTAVN